MRHMLRIMNEPKGDNIKENPNVVKQWNKVTKNMGKVESQVATKEKGFLDEI